MIEEPSYRAIPELLDRFQAFVAELDRQRALVRHNLADRLAPPEPGKTDLERDFPPFLLDAPVALSDQLDDEDEEAPASNSPDPELILDRLQAYLEAELRQVGKRYTDLMLAQYREVQYAMVALADDLFIHEIDWDGREVWRSNHLEHRLFRSRLAGDRIFERIDALLVSGDRRLVQLASVYLCILSLGFRGRHRGPGGEQRIREISERLFSMISGREPALLSSWSSGTMQPIILSAYQHTIKGDASRQQSWRPRWIYVIFAILALWLVAGQLLWSVGVVPISDAAQAVLRSAGDVR